MASDGLENLTEELRTLVTALEAQYKRRGEQAERLRQAFAIELTESPGSKECVLVQSVIMLLEEGL